LIGREPDKGASFDDAAAALAGHLAEVGRTRDRAAFAALFTHFAPRLKSYFLRMGVTAAAAEDLAQEAMFMIWRKAALYDPAQATASTWIFTIARNLRADAMRRERRQPGPVETMDSDVAVTDPAPGPEGLLASARSEACLRGALRTLPEEQARVVELSYFGDRSHVEIGHELGIPLGTVKGRLRQALRRLRATLAGEKS
jgi:RNA polymerase sigma-70 factor (ECF subfamily)